MLVVVTFLQTILSMNCYKKRRMERIHPSLLLHRLLFSTPLHLGNRSLSVYVKVEPNVQTVVSIHQRTFAATTKVYYISPDRPSCIVCKCTPAATLPILTSDSKGPGKHINTHCWECANKKAMEDGTIFNPDPPACGCGTQRESTFKNCANCMLH